MKRSWIERRLKHLGHTKGELASAMDLPPSRISEILSDKRALKVSELNQLALFLELPLCQITKWLTATPENLRGLAPRRKSRNVWVVGHQQGDAAKPELWPKDAHYLINLPLPAQPDDVEFYATEVQNQQGQMGGLQVFSSKSGPRSTLKQDQTAPEDTIHPIGKYIYF